VSEFWQVSTHQQVTKTHPQREKTHPQLKKHARNAQKHTFCFQEHISKPFFVNLKKFFQEVSVDRLLFEVLI
jgi:hypothetical protein